MACVQGPVAFGDPGTNVAATVTALERLAGEGVEIAVFPECSLTGYCVSTAAEAARISLRDAEATLHPILEACGRHGIHAVVGYARADAGRLWNAAALVTPDGNAFEYRKVHLPCLGFDRFATPGDALPVFETRLGRIGVLICYDMRPPEAARTLALKGADLIVLPTNWPEGAEISADHVAIARAAENRVFFASCNRTGEENGFRFIGKSKILDITGKPLASAVGGEATTLIADLDLPQARQKRAVIRPGEYELEILGCRRPELYGEIARG